MEEVFTVPNIYLKSNINASSIRFMIRKYIIMNEISNKILFQ